MSTAMRCLADVVSAAGHLGSSSAKEYLSNTTSRFASCFHRMDLGQYLERSRSIRTHDGNESLCRDMVEADNTGRKPFSQQHESWVVPELSSLHHSLIPGHWHPDVFEYMSSFAEDWEVPKVYPLGEEKKPAGASCIVSQADMESNFSDLFTEGMLKYMDWRNVFVAGGSVLACVLPMFAEYDKRNRKCREYMHDVGFPARTWTYSCTGWTQGGNGLKNGKPVFT